MSSLEAALLKLQQYCAYQDRCHQEVRSKLIKMKVYGDRLEQIMASLVEDDFLNEERYAKAYTTGKLKMNQWGRIKIRQHLKSKRVSEYCIRKGIEMIDEDEYLEILVKLLDKQSRQYKIKAINNYQLKGKLFQYAASKGFETESIKAAFSEMDLE